ncbi:P-loop containing nucleoside triphosphate hydrolase protein [Radiomyces spectabilis]|uniref:P-loop containing nucleoside triphosphate hydrolase protein n=1 Tax=Radiomyces spectabilis TaxID=64574 RepID=UPI00221FFC44|nr:P-loop containing nucleoside triphosphate hydrolase protein [Radiomyces spectabilis]KAI8379617.1 P-loop containing nucleoside triphosphate hydrolase protein [Radiomyces spectabilis]
MRPFYTLWTTNRWLFVRVELLGSFLSLFISVMLVRKMDTIDAGLAGIALTFAIHLLEYIYWLMRQSTTVDMHFEAVERINEFVNLPQEPPGIVEGCRPPAAWPVTAGIQVRDLTVNFGPDEQPMLEHVSFNVLPGEKVAILSRANGEKEALIACFFRFVDPLRGSIKIDGVNIAWIGVQDLRSRMTFIPKTGGMMNGTIRSNLDPFGEYDDYELWQALYRVELASLPSSETTDNNNGNIIEDLDMEIQEDDERLSIGTRQLLCMARGILRDCTRLVIMEEVDLTDEMNHKIKHIIHREFEGSTMLVITNRLQSTRHYDRVLVFDHRIVAEDDTPGELLSSQSMLRSLFERAGILTEEEEMEEDLEE